MGPKHSVGFGGQFVKAGMNASVTESSLFIVMGAHLEEDTVLQLGAGTYCKQWLRQEPAVSKRTDSLTA